MVFPDYLPLFASEVNLCLYPWRLETACSFKCSPLFPATKDQVSNNILGSVAARVTHGMSVEL